MLLRTSLFIRIGFLSLAVCAVSISLPSDLIAQTPSKAPGTAKPSATPLATPTPAAPVPSKPPLPRVISIHIRQADLQTELALNEADREHGLMDRKDLPDNDAMLFVLPKPEQATFWMKNTLIPLSIAYINKDGVILEIHDMQPLDTTITPSDSKEVCYALECNQHWFELNGIHAGDKLDCAPYKISDFTPQ